MIDIATAAALQAARERGILPQRRARVAEMIEHTSPKQRAWILDQARRKVAVCASRAGKSNGAARLLLKTAYEFPGCLCLFIAIPRQCH